jgi:hypothetical protein
VTDPHRLAGLGPQFEAPSADDNLRRVANTLRSTVRQQGEVMSLTLSNNALLWEERGQMQRLIAELRSDLGQATRDLLAARVELDKLGTPELRSLQELRQENEALAASVVGLKKALQLHLVDAIGPEELKKRLVAMEAQGKELKAAGVKPSELMVAQDARAKARRAQIEATHDQRIQDKALAEVKEQP